jgi:hypothetical protein
MWPASANAIHDAAISPAQGADSQGRDAAPRQPLCADIDGFSLHAAVRCEAHDRKRLERLCRYITRPALSDERVQCNAAGQVEWKLKTPWCDGTTHLRMLPLEFMQQPVATVVGTLSRSRETRASDCFAAANLGRRMPGLGRIRL